MVTENQQRGEMCGGREPGQVRGDGEMIDRHWFIVIAAVQGGERTDEHGEAGDELGVGEGDNEVGGAGGYNGNVDSMRVKKDNEWSCDVLS